MNPFVFLLAAAVAALLFWLLSEAGEPPAVARRTLFALMGGAVVVLLVGARAPAERQQPPSRGDPGRAFRSYTEALLGAKASLETQVAPSGSGATDLRSRAIHSYQEAIHYAPDSALFRRQLGILYAFDGRREAARQQ